MWPVGWKSWLLCMQHWSWPFLMFYLSTYALGSPLGLRGEGIVAQGCRETCLRSQSHSILAIVHALIFWPFHPAVAKIAQSIWWILAFQLPPFI